MVVSGAAGWLAADWPFAGALFASVPAGVLFGAGFAAGFWAASGEASRNAPKRGTRGVERRMP